MADIRESRMEREKQWTVYEHNVGGQRNRIWLWTIAINRSLLRASRPGRKETHTTMRSQLLSQVRYVAGEHRLAKNLEAEARSPSAQTCDLLTLIPKFSTDDSVPDPPDCKQPIPTSMQRIPRHITFDPLAIFQEARIRLRSILDHGRR